ncbi:hypothetical protein EAH_00063490 [Eimeria acervulina]|uniref:Uncharacterized protein n=1 Tax=Eimeria acervulina TaxID=5801 RepID=U6GNQ2_EIMAC|nr:hypothetical protein EAH_00063490 [Eimeria acervulina]CDI81846.1 hypothetical protein EAH_00063490 [Eimeria acervulina]
MEGDIANAIMLMGIADLVRSLGNSGHRLVTVYWKAESGVYVNASQYFEFHKLLGRRVQSLHVKPVRIGFNGSAETKALTAEVRVARMVSLQHKRRFISDSMVSTMWVKSPAEIDRSSQYGMLPQLVDIDIRCMGRFVSGISEEFTPME